MQAMHRGIFLLCIGVAVSGCANRPAITQYDRDVSIAKLETPKICVALSGGGLRSAAFSTGILRALASGGGLHKIDVMSSASGGGWAQLWLHARLADGNSLNEIFGGADTKDSKILGGLERRLFIDKFWQGWTVAWGPFRAAKSAYFAAISTKFGNYSTSHEAVVRNVIDHQLPVPIFIASTFSRCYSNDSQEKKYEASGPDLQTRLTELMPMSAHLVEIAPTSWGSEAIGFSTEFPFQLRNVEEWAKISSAAVDAPGYRKCETLRALGLAFGESVATPKTQNRPITEQQEVYIADGGFVDNLATRNLIRRGCKSILISDAEYDPSLIFEGFLRLKADMITSNSGNLILPAIEKWLQTRGLEACPKELKCFQADQPSNPIVQSPVIEGCISKSSSCDQPSDVIARVLYIKLSINPDDSALSNYSSAVSSFYADSRKNSSCTINNQGNSETCAFPHTPTFKTDYSPREYRAYRLLAEDIFRMQNVTEKFFK